MAFHFVRRLAAVAVVALCAVPLAAQQPTPTAGAAEAIISALDTLTDAQIDAMSEAELRKLLEVEEIVLLPETQPFFRGAPGTSSGSPGGFGAAWRDGFAGGGYQQSAGGGKADGSMAFGFGLGNPQDAIGLEVSIASLSSFRSGLFDRTAFSFKAHRMVSASAAIGVGVENAFIAGGGDNGGGTSVYIAASQVLQPTSGPFSLVTIGGGVGNGRFRFEKDQVADNKTVNVFASVGAQFHEQASVLLDWSGQDLAAGLSVVPFTAFPVILTPTLNNLTGQNGNDIRFSLGFGIGMRF